VPMLFMGEEYGDDAPFFFFSDYREEDTVRRLVEGRKQQFGSFGWQTAPRDPQEESTFVDSRLHWEQRGSGHHALLLEWHRRLLALRREHPVLSDLSKDRVRADVNGGRGLSIYRYSARRDLHVVCLFNFSDSAALSFGIGYATVEKGGDWTLLLSSAEEAAGSIAAGGSVCIPPMSIAVYERSR